jgi:sugar O-acyltransferase (sialic acid O-acetyltransferase NeuD family)
MSKVVLFGAGKIAEEALFYLTHDSAHQVVAFTVDSAFITAKEKMGLPVLPFEEVTEQYPPGDFSMFIAVGYQDLNRFRARKYEEAKAKGYRLISYISSRACAFGKVEAGENCFILEFSVVQPSARVGNNVFVWCSNHIGHHSSVGDHCYVSGNVMISGNTTVEPYCYFGVGSTIGHEITIGRESFIGAGCLITKNAPPKSVYIAPDTPRYRLDSTAFLQLSKMMRTKE